MTVKLSQLIAGLQVLQNHRPSASVHVEGPELPGLVIQWEDRRPLELSEPEAVKLNEAEINVYSVSAQFGNDTH